MELNIRRNKKKHYRSKTMEIHSISDKKQSHAMHWGFTNGNQFSNNEQKINDDEFIAALSPAPKSIEDMFLSYKSDEIHFPTNNDSHIKIFKTNETMSTTSYDNDSSDEGGMCDYTAYI
eukprot:546315_1